MTLALVMAQADPAWLPFLGMGMGVLGMGIGVIAILTEHMRKQKALEVLRAYAEKGTEPPDAILDSIARATNSPPVRKYADTRRNHLSRAAFFGVMALGFGLLFAWLWNDADHEEVFLFLVGFGITSFVMAAVCLSLVVRGLLAPAGDGQ